MEAAKSGSHFGHKERLFFFTAFKVALGPTQPLLNGYRGLFCKGRETGG
jgi:hypothetical protein